MKNSCLLLILCLSLITQIQLKANHIIGGEMAYECLSPGQYLFSLTLYRDAEGIGPALGDETITVYLQGGLSPFLTLEINEPIIEDIEPDLSNLCPENSPDINIQRGVYEFLLELPNDPDGYLVVFQRCCRNEGILNIVEPNSNGATYNIKIPPSNEPNECINNSAIFNYYPPLIICENEYMIFDHAATDMDGDSLVYEICPPLLGGSNLNLQPVPAWIPPYDEVPWIGDYNSEYQIPSEPAMAIDPQTGVLTLRPTQQGLFITAICAHEYRDGELINTISRDFQFNIAECDLISIAISSNTNGNTDFAGDLVEEISFNNDTIIGCTPMAVSFNNITEGADGFYWNFGNGEQQIIESPANPIIYEEEGNYTAFMVANDSNCDIEDTLFFHVKAIDPAPITPNFNVVFPNDCEDLTMSFINQTEYPTGVEEEYTYKWLLGNGNSTQEENINEFTYLFPNFYEVSLITFGPAPCYSSDTITKTIAVGCNVANEDKYQLIDRCQVYPNPSADLFQIELEPAFLDQEQLSIKVYDINGQLILSQTDTSLDLSNQNAGIYLLQLFHDNFLIKQEKLILLK